MKCVACAVVGVVSFSGFGCTIPGEHDEIGAIERIAPASVSDADAWALFDRSIASTYVPTTRDVRIDLEGPVPIAAVKVFGGASYRMTVRAPDGSSLGFDALDLASLGAGWHSFAPHTVVSTTSVSLHFELTGTAGGLPEVELWAPLGSTGRSGDAASKNGPATDDIAGQPDEATIEPGGCATFSFPLKRSPTQYRRVHLAYTYKGAYRAFGIQRSINGRAIQGGKWLAADSVSHELIEELNPADLHLGSNAVKLCLPSEAAETAITKLRLSAETDQGFGFVTKATVGDALRDASNLLDRDSTTFVAIAPNETVHLAFERLIEPDALLLDPSIDALPTRVECVDSKGGTTELHATKSPVGVALDGASSACALLNLSFAEAISVHELDVVGSGAGNRVDWPHLVVTNAKEHFGKFAWVSGFTARPESMTGAVRVSVQGKPVGSAAGDFATLIERQTVEPKWTVSVETQFPGGAREFTSLVLDRNEQATLAAAAATLSPQTELNNKLFGAEGASVVVPAPVASPSQVLLGTNVGVNIPAGAVNTPTQITAKHLGRWSLPPLDPGMINVTAPAGHGYEFLPHGQRFARAVEVLVPFDPHLIPAGMKLDDVHTYYYDTKAKHWRMLQRNSFDVANSITKSSTDHFTVMINALIATPTDTPPLSMDPTSVSSIAPASPSAGIDMIEPPVANPSGDARLSYPIRLPPGRGAYSPSVALTYSSDAGNGFLGVGWALSTSRIEIDTRWGAPTYADTEEPRYVLDGAEIVPTTEVEGPTCTSGPTKRYHLRVEGAFSHIIRCGTDPSNYYFEVRDRNGTKYVYGTAGSDSGNASVRSLKPRPGSCSPSPCAPGVYRWSLRRVVDMHQNETTFSYQIDDIADVEPGRDVYPQSITYTAHPTKPAHYTVEFVLDNGTRPDKIVNGRPGFKMLTRHLLRSIRVKYDTEVVREYVLTYAHGEFKKSVLNKIRAYGTGGCSPGLDAFQVPTCSAPVFHEHILHYFSEPHAFEPVTEWNVQGDPTPTTSTATKGQSITWSAGLSLKGKKGPAEASLGVQGSTGDRSELIGFYDLNGDGLADQLFSTSTLPVALYNHGPSTSAFSLEGPLLYYLFASGHEKHTSLGVDASVGIKTGAFGASSTFGFNNSTTRADRVLMDVDGDGFIDLLAAKNAQTLFSSPCYNNTGQCFNQGDFSATQAVSPANDTLLQDFNNEINERLVLGDPVLQWTAPYTGTANIIGSVALVRAGTVDGVEVELYRENLVDRTDDLLAGWSLTDSTGSVGINLPAISLTAGQRLYLRTKTGADLGIVNGERRDEIAAGFRAVYTSACQEASCSLPAFYPAGSEPTGALVSTFDSEPLSDQKRVTATRPVVAPISGTLSIHGQILKSVSAADIRTCVQKFPAGMGNNLNWGCDDPNSPATKVWNTHYYAQDSSTNDTLTVSFAVDRGDLIVLRAESDWSIDPGNIAFAENGVDAPLSYTDACLPVPNSNACQPTMAAEDLSEIPLPNGSFGFYVAAVSPPQPEGAVPLPFVTPAELVHWQLDPFPNPLPGNPPCEIAIRSNVQHTMQVFQCGQTCTPAQSLFATQNSESLSVEVRSDSTALPPHSPWPHITIKKDGGPAYQVPLIFRKRTPDREQETPFVGGYRGWRGAFWNETVPFEPTRLLDDLTDPSNLSLDRIKEIVISALEPTPALTDTAWNTVGNIGFAWIGPSSQAFITVGGRMSASKIGNVGPSLPASPGSILGDIFDPYYVRLSGTRSHYAGQNVDGSDVLSSAQIDPGLSAVVTTSDTTTTTDMMDLDGDGVADLVAGNNATRGVLAATVAPSLPGFYFEGGLRHSTGFDYSVGLGSTESLPVVTSLGRHLRQDAKGGPGGTIGLAFGRSQTTQEVADMNGDGLPDLVRRDGTGVQVSYNLGSSFGAWESIGTVDTTLPAIDGFQSFETSFTIFGELLSSTSSALEHETTVTQHVVASFSLNLGVFKLNYSYTTRTTASRVARRLIDLNGDGLPDLLQKSPGGPIKVQFNLGDRFEAHACDWITPNWTYGTTSLELGPSFDSGFNGLLVAGTHAIVGPDVLAGTSSQTSTVHTGKVSLSGYSGAIEVTADLSRARDTDTYELALVDVTGDGAVDQVLRRGSGTSAGHLYVKRNQQTGRANLLASIDRPLHGSFSLDYAPVGNTVEMPHQRHVLSRVEIDDGVNLGANFESPNFVTTFSYEHGHYDRYEREFLGFGKVTEHRADNSTVERQYDNQNFYTHGALLHQIARDAASTVWSELVTSYDVRAVLGANQAPVPPDPSCSQKPHVGLDSCTPKEPVVVSETEARSEGGATAKSRTTEGLTYDRFGNRLSESDTGDDAFDSDNTDSTAEYSNNATTWILGQPTSIEIRQTSTHLVLRSRAASYNGLGELESVSSGTGAGNATSTFKYDQYGNLYDIATPPNEHGEVQEHFVEFDDTVATYPKRIMDAFGYSSTANYDLRFGVATTSVDINGSSISREYDDFGRLIKVYGPYSPTPVLELSYFQQEVPARAVTTVEPTAPSSYTGPLPPQTTTVTVVDGLGRPIELRHSASVAGDDGMITSDFVARDALGRVVKTYQPFFTTGASTSFVPPLATLSTTTTYDVLGRPLVTTHPDASTEVQAYTIATSPAGDLLFRAQHTDENGHHREVFTDMAGLTRANVVHPSGQTSAVTTFDYLPTGELTRIVDAGGAITQLGYDLRGLRTSLNNPDTGLIEDHYDLLGNRIATIEPNHRAIGGEVHFNYERDRLVSIAYPSKPPTRFVYGAPGASDGQAARIAEVHDESGTQIHYYDELGNIARTLRTVDRGGDDFTFDLRITTDSLGHQLQIGYPDGMVLTNTYDAGGKLASVEGSGDSWTRTYADRIKYDVFGNRTSIRLGNGVITTTTFDPARVRLSSVTTALPGGGNVQDLHYTYDPAGNPTHISNTLASLGGQSSAQMPGPSSETLTYDDADRLTHVVASAALSATATTNYDQTFAYDVNDRILSKARSHSIVDGATTQPPETNFSSTYDYSIRPHLPDRIGNLDIEYDPSGNPIHRFDSTTGEGPVLTWDDDGRLVQIDDQHNVFDAAGLRVRRIDETAKHETVFSSPYFDAEADDNYAGVRRIFAGSQPITTDIASWDPKLGLDPAPTSDEGRHYYLHSDHLGSTSVVTNDSGEVEQSLEYFVDGEQWIDRNPTSPANGYLFNGKPFDQQTGLYDYGQRFYDPRSSLWLGVDPAFTDSPTSAVSTPRVLSLGAYAGHSPGRFVDPDGRQSRPSNPGDDPYTPGIVRDLQNTPGVTARATIQAGLDAEPYVEPYVMPVYVAGQATMDFALDMTPILGTYRAWKRGDGLGVVLSVVGDAGWLLAAARGAKVAVALTRAEQEANAGRVLIDSNAVAGLSRDSTLGGRIRAGEQPVVSYVTGPELRNAAAKAAERGRGLRGVPRALATLPVLESRPPLDHIISLRGALQRVTGRFGDGIIGAQALFFGIPLVTNDAELARVVRALGGTVR